MSEQKGRLTVQLQCYKTNAKGEASYNAKGEIQSENQKLTLTYGDLQWTIHLGNLPQQGWGKIDVLGIIRGNEDLDNKSDEFERIKQEVADFYKKPVTELTPEQQRIADLEHQLSELTKMVKGKSTVDDKTEPEKEAVVALKDEREPLWIEYKTLRGNDANKTWGEKKLTEEINKIKAAK